MNDELPPASVSAPGSALGRGARSSAEPYPPPRPGSILAPRVASGDLSLGLPRGGVPPLAAGEYWISLPLARRWLDDGVFSIVSPLDSENRTEIELREEHEDWLTWMVTNEVERVRLD